MSTQSDLEKHEAVCVERYNGINRRLDGLDEKVDAINEKFDNFKTDVYKVFITSTVTIVSVLIGAVIAILNHH